jgi:hypothetical protein
MHAAFTGVSDFSQVPGEILELLAQIGYIAINQGFNAEAQVSFEVLIAVRANSKDAILLQATTQLFLGKIKEGTKGLVEI